MVDKRLPDYIHRQVSFLALALVLVPKIFPRP